MRLAVTMLTLMLSAVPALAARTEPAVIPPDVLDALVDRPGDNERNPLADALAAALDATLVQVDAADAIAPAARSGGSESLATRKETFAALRLEAQRQLEATRERASARDDAARSQALDALRRQVDERFRRIIAALDAIDAAASAQARESARTRAARLLRDLRRAQVSAPVAPIATFRQGEPLERNPAWVPAGQLPRHASGSMGKTWRYAKAPGLRMVAGSPPSIPANAAAECAHTVADLDVGASAQKEVQVPATSEIRDLASSLDYSPARIFRWVYENVAYEPYYGSLKGARATLLAQAGNDTDQASLLVALLRVSNIPARYVLGIPNFQNDLRVARWVGARTMAGALKVLRAGLVPTAADSSTAPTIMQPSHVWVEACLPYSHYRGARMDSTGHRWIPLDPSFKDKTYQPGITQAAAFNYTSYLARRTNGPDSLPHEAYAQQVEASLPANSTLKDVAYSGTVKPLRLDVLPSSLPFDVVQYLAWPGSSSAEASTLPDAHRYRLQLTVKDAANRVLTSATLRLPEHALNRLTLSPKPTAASQSAFDAWRLDSSVTTTPSCTIDVLPVVKSEGIEVAVAATPVSLCTTNNVLNMQVLLPELGAGDCASVPVSPACVNTVTYTNISAAAMNALQAYAFQASDRHLSNRAKRLLDSVRSTGNPNTNLEETEGEYLNLVGLKYMRYISDAGKRVGQLDGGSGESGNHLGLASSQMKVSYLFDLPFAVNRKGFLIDVPGGISRNVDLSSGNPVFKTFLLSGYASSAYEAYIWQENSRLDAVSTVRGLQFANETGIGTITATSANWTTVRAQLSVYPGASAADCSYNPTTLQYPRCIIDDTYAGVKRLIDLGYTVKLPRSLLRYGDWKGFVYEADRSVANASDPVCPHAYCASYIISGLAGGVTVYNQVPITIYDPATLAGYQAPGTTPSNINPPDKAPQNVNGSTGTGSCGGQACSGDPVQLITGNVYHSERDISIPGRGGLPIVFERSYNSRMAALDTACVPIGCGWTHSFNHYIKFYGTTDGPAKISWIDGTGTERFFSTTSHASGNITLNTQLTNSPAVHVTFRREANGTYTIREKNGLLYTFESVNGTVGGGQRARLSSISDRNGNALTMAYAGADLTTVKDGLNRTLTFLYAAGRITQITDFNTGAARMFKYGYEADGDLSSYRNAAASLATPPADAGPVSYSYYTASDGANLNHALKQYVLPNGNGMQFEYYANARAFRHATLACASSPLSPTCQINTFTYNDFRRETVQVSERGFTRRFLFDQYGNTLKVVEENGAEHDYTYDGAPGNRLTSTGPLRYTTSYTYDANGNVTSVRSPRGAVATFDNYLAAFGFPQRVKDAAGNYTVLEYDARGNVTNEIRLRAGATAPAIPYTRVAADIAAWIQYQYDTFGNRTHTIRIRNASAPGGANPTTIVSYDGNALYPTGVSRSGDRNGDGLINSSDPVDSKTLAFDALGRMTTGIDADWHTLTYTYDLMDRRRTGTDAAGKQRTYSYDKNGNLTENKLIIGSTTYDQTQLGFDASDRLISVTALGNGAGNAQTTTVYDASGNAVKITNPDALSIAVDYDEANRPIRATDQRGNFASTVRDVDGRLRCTLDPNGNAIFYTYWDGTRDGKLRRIYAPSARSCPGSAPGSGVRATEYDYDANGNVISVTQIGADGSARVSFTAYDALNRPWRQVGPQYTDAALGAIRPVTEYTYNLLGHLVQVLTGYCTSSATGCAANPVLAPQLTIGSDDFGRRIRETDATGKSVLYEYDINNNVSKRTDAKNQVTTFAWTFGHRLAARTNLSAGNVDLTYNNLGQVATAATRIAGSGTTSLVQYSYTYDSLNQLDTITDSRGPVVLDYDFSPGGRLNALRDNAGNHTNYLYDAVGRLAGIWAPNYGTVTYRYDAGGRLREKWLPNGVNSRYSYNADGMLSQLVNRASSTSVISQHDYLYNAFGARSQHKEKVGSTALTFDYTYDSLDRLLTVKQTSPLDATQDQSYSYDPLGNLTQSTIGTPVTATTAHVFDAANQLVETRSGSPSGPMLSAYVYDANGSLTKKCEGGSITRSATDCATTGGVVTALTYDSLDRLIQAVKGTSTEVLAYDHEGRRVRRISGGTTTNYLYNGPDIHAEYGTTYTAPAAQYTHGPNWDDPVMRITGTGPTATATYYHQDGLGSIVAVSTATGTIDGTQRFDAWGRKTTVTGNAIAPFGFTGREPDASGLTYYRARYYDPGMRRFTQRDPIGFRGGINLYAYVGNNPTHFTDPLGLLPQVQLGASSAYFNGFVYADAGRVIVNGIVCDMCHSGDASNEAYVPSLLETLANPALDALQAPLFGPEDLLTIGVTKAASLAAFAFGKGISKSAAELLPKMKGMGVTERMQVLSDNGFSLTKVSNSAARNETWTHPDGSEVRVHQYGNMYPSPYRSGNNAHLHKQDAQGFLLNDRGIRSIDPGETHIGLPNPSDFPKVRGRPHGS